MEGTEALRDLSHTVATASASALTAGLTVPGKLRTT